MLAAQKLHKFLFRGLLAGQCHDKTIFLDARQVNAPFAEFQVGRLKFRVAEGAVGPST
jgi:hypothetical protein